MAVFSPPLAWAVALPWSIDMQTGPYPHTPMKAKCTWVKTSIYPTLAKAKTENLESSKRECHYVHRILNKINNQCQKPCGLEDSDMT